MKSKNPVTILTGIILVIIFVLMVFTFQVRQTEVAVVTTFDSPKGFVTNAGLHFKWPSPIQKVYKFDNRTHNFEDQFAQGMTRDSQPLLVMLYVGWRISDPRQFFSSFQSGNAEAAEAALGALIKNAKGSVITTHPFSHFVSADPSAIKFTQVEKEIFDMIAPEARTRLGIEIRFAGIKRLGLPSAVTDAAMNRMRIERETQVARIKGEGDRTASDIVSEANTESARLLSAANRDAEIIKTQAEAEAAKALEIYAQEPELFRVLMTSKALPEIMKGQSTLLLDGNKWPYSELGKLGGAAGSSNAPTRALPR